MEIHGVNFPGLRSTVDTDKADWFRENHPNMLKYVSLFKWECVCGWEVWQVDYSMKALKFHAQNCEQAKEGSFDQKRNW